MRTMLLIAMMMLVGLARAEGLVARAAFCTDVADREPIGELGSMTEMRSEVSFFTELQDLNGSTVIHRWSHGGEVRAEISFEIGADRWRTWSTKNLYQTPGEWTVAVVTSSGELLAEQSLTIEP